MKAVVAAMVISIGAVGLVGCSGDKSPSENASSASSTISSAATSATDAAKGNPPPGQADITVDGVTQNVTGQPVCTDAAGNFNIAIGQGLSGVVVVISPDASVVHSVALGNVSGVVLGFQEGVSGGQASASKDDNTYTITGTANGITAAIPPTTVSKPFEIKVTCP